MLHERCGNMPPHPPMLALDKNAMQTLQHTNLMKHSRSIYDWKWNTSWPYGCLFNLIKLIWAPYVMYCWCGVDARFNYLMMLNKTSWICLDHRALMVDSPLLNFSFRNLFFFFFRGLKESFTSFCMNTKNSVMSWLSWTVWVAVMCFSCFLLKCSFFFNKRVL